MEFSWWEKSERDEKRERVGKNKEPYKIHRKRIDKTSGEKKKKEKE